MPLSSEPTAAAGARFFAQTGLARLWVRRELYAVYPDGIGNSKLTLGVIQKALGTLCTGRNWKTVLKLEAVLES